MLTSSYIDGIRDACAALGHRHRHGDETCVCGKVPALAPSGTEVAAVQDQYLEVAADALCKERGHESPAEMHGLSGFSWRDGTCCCDEDARVVLAAAGRVAPHVGCRELLDGVERVNAHLRSLLPDVIDAPLATDEQP